MIEPLLGALALSVLLNIALIWLSWKLIDERTYVLNKLFHIRRQLEAARAARRNP